MSSPNPRKPRKIKRDVPVDEAMRIEHSERIVRPKANEPHEPADPSDQGPHVERVGMPTPDDP